MPVTVGRHCLRRTVSTDHIWPQEVLDQRKGGIDVRLVLHECHTLAQLPFLLFTLQLESFDCEL